MKTFVAAFLAVLVIAIGFVFATPQGRALWQTPPIASVMAQDLIATITSGDADEFARQLATLRHGPDLDVPAQAYLGRFTSTEGSDVRDYVNAVTISKWLPQARQAAEQSGLTNAQAAAFLSEVDAAMLAMIPAQTTTDFDTNRQNLFHDVEEGRISFESAIELISYGDITASDLTNVISSGLGG